MLAGLGLGLGFGLGLLTQSESESESESGTGTSPENFAAGGGQGGIEVSFGFLDRLWDRNRRCWLVLDSVLDSDSVC